MNFLKAYVLQITILLFVTIAHADQKIPIAINDLVSKGLDQSDADLITDRLRSELIQIGTFRVLERDQMQTILKEQGFQKSGACNESACIVEIGQLLGVQQMIAGTIGKIGSTYTFSIRMINVGSGEIMNAYSQDCRCTIDEVLTKTAKELAQRISGEQKPGKKYTTLIVGSNPSGVNCFLDGKRKGLTPYTMDSLLPGQHKIRVAYASFHPTEKVINAVGGDTIAEYFDLPNSKPAATVSEGKPIPQNKTLSATKKNDHIITKLLSGALCVGSGIFGYYMETQAKKQADLCAKAQANYETGRTAADYNTYSAQYKSAFNEGNKFSLTRNICYGTAGVFAVGFVLTFVF